MTGGHAGGQGTPLYKGVSPLSPSARVRPGGQKGTCPPMSPLSPCPICRDSVPANASTRRTILCFRSAGAPFARGPRRAV